MLLSASGGFWQSLASLSYSIITPMSSSIVPWLSSLVYLYLHMAFFSLCESKFSSFYKDTTHWIRAHPNFSIISSYLDYVCKDSTFK